MRKGLCLFFVTVLLASSCASVDTRDGNGDTVRKAPSGASMREQHAAGHWIYAPLGGQMSIIGVSSPQLKRESEIESAREDAARQLAMYHGMNGTVELLHRSGSGFLDYASTALIDLRPDSGYEQFLDALSFDPEQDVLRGDGAVFVRMKSGIPAPAGMSYETSVDSSGTPLWINSVALPRFAGYATAVGFARNQRWLKDTIVKSAEAAAARMIENVASEMTTSETASAGYGSSTTIHMRGAGRLENFRVLEFWIEPGTMAVYTLAVARVSGQAE